MLVKRIKFFMLNWICKCGNHVPDDRNFCMYCDRERPINMKN